MASVEFATVKFEWDEANAEHVARHGVSIEEAEQAVGSSRLVRIGGSSVAGERRFTVLAQTEEGRLLVVVVTHRGRALRVVTARDANTGEARRFRRR